MVLPSCAAFPLPAAGPAGGGACQNCSADWRMILAALVHTQQLWQRPFDGTACGIRPGGHRRRSIDRMLSWPRHCTLKVSEHRPSAGKFSERGRPISFPEASIVYAKFTDATWLDMVHSESEVMRCQAASFLRLSLQMVPEQRGFPRQIQRMARPVFRFKVEQCTTRVHGRKQAGF